MTVTENHRSHFRRTGDEEPMQALDILIAESNLTEVAMIREALSPLWNNLEVYTDRKEACHRLRREGKYSEERRTPDLVILDADMLGESCWEMIAELREEKDYSEAAVVVVSERNDAELANRAREAGASCFALKPLRLDTLADMVERIEGVDLAVVGHQLLPTKPEMRE